MTSYELLLTLHVIAVTIWLGAGFLLAVLILRAEVSGDRDKEAAVQDDIAWLAPRLFIPASFATLIFGLLLVVDGDWDLDHLWLAIGLAGWLFSFGVGFFFFRPEAERIGAIVAERGPADPEIQYRAHRIRAIERVQLLVLFLVIADMFIKPTGDDAGVLIVSGALIAAASALAVASVRKAAPA